MRLHREGRIILPTLFFLLAGVATSFFAVPWGSNWAWVPFLALFAGGVFYGFVLNFFKNPPRQTPQDATAIYAPADGKVVVIEETHDPVYFQGPVLQVSIFMSPLNVHVNRAPTAGVVKWLKYFPGKFLVAWHPKSSTENEQTFVVLETQHGELGLKQIAGAVARRIRWYVTEGTTLAAGQEFGFIRFGSRVDLLLPIGTVVEVPLHSAVRGGETVLAHWPATVSGATAA